jgi:hypothetical protein
MPQASAIWSMALSSAIEPVASPGARDGRRGVFGRDLVPALSHAAMVAPPVPRAPWKRDAATKGTETPAEREGTAGVRQQGPFVGEA